MGGRVEIPPRHLSSLSLLRLMPVEEIRSVHKWLTSLAPSNKMPHKKARQLAIATLRLQLSEPEITIEGNIADGTR